MKVGDRLPRAGGNLKCKVNVGDLPLNQETWSLCVFESNVSEFQDVFVNLGVWLHVHACVAV